MQNEMMIALGRAVFFHRNWLFLALFVVVFAAYPPLAPGVGETLLDYLGGLAILAGLGVRALVIGVTPVPREGTAKRVDADALKTEGLFSLCRNPLYVGNVLISTGVFLIHGRPLAIVLGIALTIFLYQAIIANEENFLKGKFGAAYDRYMGAVNRWLPDLTRLPSVLRGMHFNLGRWLSIEWTVIFMAALVSGSALWLEAASARPPASVLVIYGLGLVLGLLGLSARRRLRSQGR